MSLKKCKKTGEKKKKGEKIKADLIAHFFIDVLAYFWPLLKLLPWINADQKQRENLKTCHKTEYLSSTEL